MNREFLSSSLSWSIRILLLALLGVAVSACNLFDSYEKEAKQFSEDSRYYLEYRDSSSDPLSEVDVTIIREKIAVLNEFLNRNDVKSRTANPYVKEIRDIRARLMKLVDDWRSANWSKQFRIDLPVVGTGSIFTSIDVWENGLRSHLINHEKVDPSTSATYAGHVSILCPELKRFLANEFPNEDVMERFRSSLERAMTDPVPDHQMVLVFDLALGSYDNATKSFPVERILFGDRFPAISRNWQQVNDDIVFNRKNNRNCSTDTRHSSKDFLQIPNRVTLSWDLNFKGVMSQLRKPVSVDPELAESTFSKINPQQRSVYALAYFDQAQWVSSGTLGSGYVTMSANAVLRHLEFYSYSNRKKSRDGYFFNTAERRKRPTTGTIFSDTFFKGRPQSAPLASRSVR